MDAALPPPVPQGEMMTTTRSQRLKERLIRCSSAGLPLAAGFATAPGIG
jgi:hypothetical protein